MLWSVVSVVNALELKEHMNKQAKTLSAGLKRKVSAHFPPLLATTATKSGLSNQRSIVRSSGAESNMCHLPTVKHSFHFGMTDLLLHAATQLRFNLLSCFQQLCFALSMIGNPQVVLLDEPSSGMDPKSKQRMW